MTNLSWKTTFHKRTQTSPFYVPTPDGVPAFFATALTFAALFFVGCLYNDGVTSIINWPLIGCITIKTEQSIYYMLYTTLLATITGFLAWLSNLTHEGVVLGAHTMEMQKAFKLGFLLFLLSEVMFFFAIFWSYFYFYINPSIWIGGVWPPIGIQALSFLQLPLSNTIILVSSGFSVNWAHFWIRAGYRKRAIDALYWTLMLGILFALLQFLEYGVADYSINDSVYGSIFYFGTGFHGFHVILGILGLTISFIRLWKLTYTTKHHLGFWAGAFYWHFVDIIWLLLFAIFYIWGTY